MFSKLETLKVLFEGRIATVALNRPDVRNAFHPTMIRELTEVFTALSARTDLSVLVLRGEGASFCSGADLGYMRSMADYTLAENRTDSERLFGMFWALRSCSLPIVGLLHGHVMGGALGLAALCDVAAAVEGTQFCFSEARLGIVPGVISPFVLERMQVAAARRYMITAELFGARDAETAGLVQFVGDATAVEEFVKKTAQAIAANGPEAVRATKDLVRAMLEVTDWDKRRALTTELIAERRVSAEGQEGLRGFLEKRRPSWKPAN